MSLLQRWQKETQLRLNEYKEEITTEVVHLLENCTSNGASTPTAAPAPANLSKRRWESTSNSSLAAKRRRLDTTTLTTPTATTSITTVTTTEKCKFCTVALDSGKCATPACPWNLHKDFWQFKNQHPTPPAEEGEVTRYFRCPKARNYKCKSVLHAYHCRGLWTFTIKEGPEGCDMCTTRKQKKQRD
jgi:hypothetical protein